MVYYSLNYYVLSILNSNQYLNLNTIIYLITYKYNESSLNITRLIKEQLIVGDFLANMKLLQVLLIIIST